MNVKWLTQAHSLEWHLGLLILGPGSFHPIIPQPHSLPCCHGNKNRGWRKLLLCRTVYWSFSAWLVYPPLTMTLQARDLVPACSHRPAWMDNQAVVQLSHPLRPPKLCCLLAFSWPLSASPRASHAPVHSPLISSKILSSTPQKYAG